VHTMKYILRTDPSKDDDSWHFSVPPKALLPPLHRPNWGKSIRFTAKEIVFEITQHPSNRILHDDDPPMFILASFAELRFQDGGLRVVTDYISRLMKAGLFLNDVQYRFYHHSNSQLVRSGHDIYQCSFLVVIFSEVEAASCDRPGPTRILMQGSTSSVILVRL